MPDEHQLLEWFENHAYDFTARETDGSWIVEAFLRGQRADTDPIATATGDTRTHALYQLLALLQPANCEPDSLAERRPPIPPQNRD